MGEKRKSILESARQASLANRSTTAKSLWDKLRQEEAKVREDLKGKEDKNDLALELHAPSGSVIRMAHISYYADTDDALLVTGRDVSSRGEECKAIVPVESFNVIFRINEVSSKPERNPVGFHAVRAEGTE